MDTAVNGSSSSKTSRVGIWEFSEDRPIRPRAALPQENTSPSEQNKSLHLRTADLGHFRKNVGIPDGTYSEVKFFVKVYI